MKRLTMTIAAVLCVWAGPVAAGHPGAGSPKTQLEKAMQVKEQLVVKERRVAGTFNLPNGDAVWVKVFMVRHLGQKAEKVQGLLIKVVRKGTHKYRVRTFVDADEVPGLLQAMGAILEREKKFNEALPKHFVEVSYATRGALTVGVHVRGGKTGTFLKDRGRGNAKVVLPQEKFAQLKSMIESGAKLMGS